MDHMFIMQGARNSDHGTDSSCVLREEHAYYGGMHLHYTLRAHSSETGVSFSVEVSHAGERCVLSLGEDVLFAVECFRTLRDGLVTPISAEEILEDLRFAQKAKEKL